MDCAFQVVAGCLHIHILIYYSASSDVVNRNIANSKTELYLLERGQEVENMSRELLYTSHNVLKREQQKGEYSLNLLEIGANLPRDLPHPDADLHPSASE